MPEAIVKDPNLGGERAGRKERYHEEGENDWEQGEGDPDAEGDGDEEWRAGEKRKEKQLQREALEAKMREFGINFESSEEDEVLMKMGRARNQQAERGNMHMRGKKRKRGLRVHKFPMDVELEKAQVRHMLCSHYTSICFANEQEKKCYQLGIAFGSTTYTSCPPIS